MDPISFFAEPSTMGTILILLAYLLANLALPVYYKKHKPADFKMVRHGVLPILGALFIVVPLYYLAKPGPADSLQLVPIYRSDRCGLGRHICGRPVKTKSWISRQGGVVNGHCQ